jgi:hypothetical protein
MSDWSLSVLLSGLHDDIQQKLAIARKSFAHPGTKGDASELVWLEMLQAYLPQRYQAASAHIVDSHGKFSDQIDVVIFDRQYSPFIFKYQGQTIVPAESVYAAFEAKQASNATMVEYAQKRSLRYGGCIAPACPFRMPAERIPPNPSFRSWAACLLSRVTGALPSAPRWNARSP